MAASSLASAQIQITSVTDTANYQAGFPQRGSLAAIFLTGLQGATGLTTNTQTPLTNALLDVQVWINFAPAPILAIAFDSGYQQINVQVPWEGERDPLYVEVFQNGSRATFEGTYSSGHSFGFYDQMPVFFKDATGHAAIQHAADYSPVTPSNPAHAGEEVIAYGINLGPVKNVPQTGYSSPVDPPAIFDYSFFGNSYCGGSDVVNVGTAQAVPDYDGLAPGLVGIYQINFKVPFGISGELPLTTLRSYTFFPLGPCEADLQKITTTATSAAALISIR